MQMLHLRVMGSREIQCCTMILNVLKGKSFFSVCFKVFIDIRGNCLWKVVALEISKNKVR